MSSGDEQRELRADELASTTPRSGPIGGDIAAILEGFGTRFRIPVLTSRHSQTSVMGLFALINGVISIAILSVAAVVSGQAFIFPSLGPTAFLLFYTPTLPAASPATRCSVTPSASVPDTWLW